MFKIKISLSLRFKYFLFIGIVHLVMAVLAFSLFWEQKVFFLVAEFGIMISLFIAFQIYGSFIRPLRFLYSGIDAIQDEDFSVKYREQGTLEMDKLIAVYNAMIDNIREERVAMEEQHYFLQKLIEASPSGILILDYDGRIEQANPTARKLLQLEEIPEIPISESPHPLLQKMAQLKPEESRVIHEQGLGRFKCERSQFIHRGFTRSFILIQELSREILEAEKRAYGKVIRMMAHEVNNSIGSVNSILGSVEEIYQSSDPEEEADVKEALQVAIRRMDGLNQFMKNFASVIRLPAPHLENLALDDLIGDIIRLTEAQSIEKGISIEYLPEENGMMIQADRRQMEQALLNILKNAREAIGDQGGTIRIKAQKAPLSIILEDDGHGIAPEYTEKLFSPFFSTKPDGQGIGLTLVREILLNHGARFSLKTREDGWTEFRIET
jgi:two-component system nitrogen regulation sensor histidine kinase NtrY